MAQIQNGGKYLIINAASQTALDISGGDNVSIICFNVHGGDNQQWVARQAGPNIYYLQNPKSGHYLSLENPDHPGDGMRVIASNREQAWSIIGGNRDTPEWGPYRISPVQNTAFGLDLEDFGRGHNVKIWGKSSDLQQPNQFWNFRAIN